MTIPTWATPFSDNTSTIGATFLNNYVRTQLPKCLDGVGGSDGIPSTPTTKLQIYGLGLELGGATNYLQYESESLTRTLESVLTNVDQQSCAVESITIGVPAETGRQNIRLSNGSTLNSVTTYHDRDDAGVVPGARVSLKVFKTNLSTGVATQIGSTTVDPAASLAAYKLRHGFSISGLSEVIDNATYIYYAVFTGESGSNNATTSWLGCSVTLTVTKQDKAP